MILKKGAEKMVVLLIVLVWFAAIYLVYRKGNESLSMLNGAIIFLVLSVVFSAFILFSLAATNEDLLEDGSIYIGIVFLGFVLSIPAYLLCEKIHFEATSKQQGILSDQKKVVQTSITSELQNIHKVKQVISEYQSETDFVNRVIVLLSDIESSKDTALLKNTYDSYSTNKFSHIRDSLIEKIPESYRKDFPKNPNEFKAYSLALEERCQYLQTIQNKLWNETTNKKDLINLSKEICPSGTNSIKKIGSKGRLLKFGIGAIVFVILSAIIAVSIYQSSALAIGMAKDCYEDSINEKFSQSTLLDAKIESIKYSEFYRSEKRITYMCSDVVCTSDSIAALKDDKEKLLAAVRELYNKSQYKMEYEHSNGYQINFDYGTWYEIYITVKDSEGNTYKYGRSSKWDEYSLFVNGEYIK